MLTITSAAAQPAVIIYDYNTGDDGHRGEYDALIARLLGSARTNSLKTALRAGAWGKHSVTTLRASLGLA